MVKNEQQRIYSKSKYGVDKFVVIQNDHIHYVEVGEGEPILLIPGAFSTYRTASRVSWYYIARTLKISRDFTEEAKTISTPILYLYGKNSDYHDMAKTNAAFLKSHLPNVEIVSFEDGIHDLELQKPGEVANLVLEFLSTNRTNEQNAFNSDPPNVKVNKIDV